MWYNFNLIGCSRVICDGSMVGNLCIAKTKYMELIITSNCFDTVNRYSVV